MNAPASPVEACPISWLRLERYALGELPAAGVREVEAHLGACAACRERAGAIAADLRPMPPLPAPRARSVWGWAAPVLLAAAALLAVGSQRLGPEPGPTVRPKASGDTVSLSLIRERDGVVAEAPTAFRDGDRFRVLLTCPPGAPVVDVVVVQGDEVAYPLDGPFDCGNEVALPGAFRLTGAAPVWVCAVEAAADRPEPSACLQLSSED